ncbi:hypothetical protein [uncultured Sphaerochaeta sp.]|uniref:hypothetical protein n=1 Tax=uncultured Sphaerochaeta sp. TaxID=886478 RepID=UPI002A0A416F|nr:hypothetical protein [uncultured Sphaerochaeta sp.]
MVATIISIISLIIALIVGILQIIYSRNQDKLNTLTKERIEKENSDDQKANIIVSFSNDNKAVILKNVGNYSAENVNIKIPDNHSHIRTNSIFPISIEPNQSISLLCSRTLTSKPKQALIISWTDFYGEKTKNIEITPSK